MVTISILPLRLEMMFIVATFIFFLLLGIEKDYSSSDSSFDSEPDTSKFEEKYEQKGIDQEEAIKALDKSDDDESEEEDEEGLTEEGKAMKKLMNKGNKATSEDDDDDEDEFDDFFKNGKSTTGVLSSAKDSKTKGDGESSSSFDELEM